MYPYYYAWKNNEKRETLYKRACRVLARGLMNSCLIEFENGQRECVSRNAIKRLTSLARGLVVESPVIGHVYQLELFPVKSAGDNLTTTSR